MRISQRAPALAGAAAVLLVGGPVIAHHSFAMFDNKQSVTLVGTVKEFQWTNPHLWVQLMVKDPATGKEVEWSIEGGSPNGMRRQGWARSSIKPGDKAEAVIHPLKDGGPGGSLVSVSVNGQMVGRTQAE
jgi:hypothetical protein